MQFFEAYSMLQNIACVILFFLITTMLVSSQLNKQANWCIQTDWIEVVLAILNWRYRELQDYEDDI